MKNVETRFTFTKQKLDALPLPSPGKRLYVYDTKVRGLGVARTNKGTLTFLVYRKINGKPERITLGRYPDLSIEQARGLASHTNSEIAQGKNPNHQKSQLRAETTFGDLFTVYLEQHAKTHKKSWESDESQYRLYLSHWSKRKLSSLHKSDIEALHAKVGKERGFYAANRMLSLLSVLFNKALHWGWEGSHPTLGIQKFREKSRERFLQGDELPRFFKALEDEPNQTLADFFMVSLLTGARRSNLLSMQWQDMDLEQAVWTIPETKNGSSQRVHLSSEVLIVLRKRLEESQSEWVFASSASASGHLEEPKSAWKRILQRANLDNLRLHDLRRTLGSWQAATGANGYIIGKSLGHKTQQATAIYARINMDPVRASVDKATQAIFSYVR